MHKSPVHIIVATLVPVLMGTLLGAARCGAGSGGDARAAERVDSTFRAPQRVTIRGYGGVTMEPFVTREGRWLLFNNANDPAEATELHYARLVDPLTAEYRGSLRGANAAGALDGVPTVDRDGTLYFVSTRSYATTLSTLYRGRFADGAVSEVALVPGIPRRRGTVVFDVEASADGSALYYASGEFRGGPVPESADLAIAVRRGAVFVPWERSAEVLTRVNTPDALEYAAALSADGLELYFTRLRGRDAAIYRATRPRPDAPFEAPARVGAITGFVEAPTLSPDGRSLYYHARAGNGFAIYRVTRP